MEKLGVKLVLYKTGKYNCAHTLCALFLMYGSSLFCVYRQCVLW